MRDEYIYASPAGAPGCESLNERLEQEQFWRSLGKKIRKGARCADVRNPAMFKKRQTS